MFITRPDTLFGAEFMAHLLRTIRWRKRRRRKIRCWPNSSPRANATAPRRRSSTRRRSSASIPASRPCIRRCQLEAAESHVANFILMDYGTGAIFRLSGARSRRSGFRQQIRARQRAGGVSAEIDPKDFVITDTAYEGDGRMINSRFLEGMTTAQAREEVARRLEKDLRGYRPVAQRQVNYRLRDWGISRQRYWAVRFESSVARVAASCRSGTRSAGDCARRRDLR